MPRCLLNRPSHYIYVSATAKTVNEIAEHWKGKHNNNNNNKETNKA